MDVCLLFTLAPYETYDDFEIDYYLVEISGRFPKDTRLFDLHHSRQHVVSKPCLRPNHLVTFTNLKS